MTIQGSDITARNPKRLSDYFRQGRRTSGGFREAPGYVPNYVPSGVPSGPTVAERTKAARDSYKQFVMEDISASDKRRKALETMWQAESEKVTSERKAAVDEYNSIMKNAPDFGDDDDGTLRAAWENEPHVQAAKDRMKAHIQASLDSSNRRPARVDTDAKGNKTITNRPPKAKAKPGDPKKGDTQTVEGVEVSFSGEVIERGGQRFFMGTDEDGKKVGVPQSALQGKKKDPEVEPTDNVLEDYYRGQTRPTISRAGDIEGTV